MFFSSGIRFFFGGKQRVLLNLSLWARLYTLLLIGFLFCLEMKCSESSSMNIYQHDCRRNKKSSIQPCGKLKSCPFFPPLSTFFFIYYSLQSMRNNLQWMDVLPVHHDDLCRTIPFVSKFLTYPAVQKRINMRAVMQYRRFPRAKSIDNCLARRLPLIYFRLFFSFAVFVIVFTYCSCFFRLLAKELSWRIVRHITLY